MVLAAGKPLGVEDVCLCADCASGCCDSVKASVGLAQLLCRRLCFQIWTLCVGSEPMHSFSQAPPKHLCPDIQMQVGGS